MYIGTWQEYKQAQILKAKNDLIEIRSGPGTPGKVFNNKTSSASTRTIFSQPLQRISIDDYYTQWRTVEQVLSKLTKTPQKPVFPLFQVRKRCKKPCQLKRVNKLREIYGISQVKSENQRIESKNHELKKFSETSSGCNAKKNFQFMDFKTMDKNKDRDLKNKEKIRSQQVFEEIGFRDIVSSFEESMSPEKVNGLLIWAEGLQSID